ncbi:MAG: aminopeptidase [Oligoflexia bacterium]|nr:aminopeptidase [Oligoflexia bacterium]
MAYWLLMCLLLSGCSSVSYLLGNGIDQWKLFNRAIPITTVKDSPSSSPELLAKIKTVAEAKSFAVNDLGLRATSNYEKYVSLDGPCLLWAVSASHEVRLEEKKWHFPIVGSVPYLGFFQKNKAEAEVVKIQKESPDYDSWVRCVPAFSSLGYFPDPLYSSMIRGSERDIVELIIHESLHSTVWVGNSVDFNEKLASFVGLEGSMNFLNKKYGENAVKDARLEVKGEKFFGEFMDEMKSLYLEKVQTIEQKKIFYQQILVRYKEFIVKKQKTAAFKPLDVKFENWNNAAFMAYLNYYSDYSIFESALKHCDGSVKKFVGWIQRLQKESGRFLDAPEEHLMEVLKGSSCDPI